jgi:biopolymer transport protein ExbB/TolQ
MQPDAVAAAGGDGTVGKVLTDTWQFLWSSNSTSGKTITALIVIFGVVAAWQALRHRGRYLGYEAHWLAEVGKKLHDARVRTPSASEPSDPDSESSLLVELSTLTKAAPEASLIGLRLKAIDRMRQARVKVNVAALQQVTLLREHAKLSLAFPGYVASVAMMLGLLGTFIGLAQMVGQIEFQLAQAKQAQAALADARTAGKPAPKTDAGTVAAARPAATPTGKPAATSAGATWPAPPRAGTLPAARSVQTWTAPIEGLTAIIASKKTVFSCTIVGLICSIGLSFLNFLLARAQSAFYSQLERFTVEELLPATVPGVEGETALERVSLRLGDSFERLESLAKGHTRTIEQLRAMEKGFQVIVDNVVTLTRQGDQKSAAEATATLATVITQLTHVSGSVTGLVEAIPQMLSTFKESQERLAQQLQAAVTNQQPGMPAPTWSAAPRGARPAASEYDSWVSPHVLTAALVVVTMLLLLSWWW